MSPFEALYGRKCRTPLMWDHPGERAIFGLAKIKEAEEGVAQVKENLKIAQSRYKSYADKRRRDLEFVVGDYVYLKVSPLRGCQIPCEREARTELRWPLQDLQESWEACLQA